MAGVDKRTPEQKDAEGKAALDQLLSREGLFGWGPVLQQVAGALAPAVAERTATGQVSAKTAASVAAAVKAALLPVEPATASPEAT